MLFITDNSFKKIFDYFDLVGDLQEDLRYTSYLRKLVPEQLKFFGEYIFSNIYILNIHTKTKNRFLDIHLGTYL